MPVILIILLLFVSVALPAAIIAHEYRRTLSYDGANAWEDPAYLRDLPNFLWQLSALQISSPWPAHCTPWSEHFFQRKLLKTVQPLLHQRARQFVIQHLALWRWIESHHAALQYLQRCYAERRARERLTMPDAEPERTALLAFLNAHTVTDAQDIPDYRTRLRLQKLTRIQTIMREHNYNLSPEFRAIDQLNQVPPDHLTDWLTQPHEPQRV